MPEPSQRNRGRLFVALAAVALSSAGLLQRELTVDVGTQLAGRALFAALGLFAYIAVAERGHVLRAFRAIGRGGIAIVVLLGLSSSAFFIALNHAPVANVLFWQGGAAAHAPAPRAQPAAGRNWALRAGARADPRRGARRGAGGAGLAPNLVRDGRRARRSRADG